MAQRASGRSRGNLSRFVGEEPLRPLDFSLIPSMVRAIGSSASRGPIGAPLDGSEDLITRYFDLKNSVEG